MNRRLAMLSHYFDEHRGGIERVAARLADELAAQDFDVLWLATGGVRADTKPSRVRRCSLPGPNLIEKYVRIPYPLLYPSAVLRIFRAVRGADAVLVHDAIYMTSVAAFLAARLYRKPFVVIQHIGLVPYRHPALRGLMQAANRLLVEPILVRADRVAFISERTLGYFAALPWRVRPILVFNGVDGGVFRAPRDADEIASARKALNLPAGKTIALFVGRFVEKKGLPILALIARQRPDILFVFAGWGALDPTGWNLPNVRVFASLSGASLAQAYQASDMLLLPSVGEGFPLVVQEALACGLPILCGLDTACADPLAAQFLTGVAVEPDPERTAQGYCEAITRLLANPDDRTRREARSQFARARYAWRASAEQYAALLNDLIPPSRLKWPT